MKFNDGKKLSDFTNNVSKIKPKGVKKIITISSAKGGVGKSTISCNLSHILSDMGLNIALIDADIYGPSIPELMNISNKPKLVDNQFIPILSNKIKCMSIGMIIDSHVAGLWRGPMINKILHQLITAVNWHFDNKEVDIMIIDMPPGTGDIYLSLLQNFDIDGSILVSTPQNLSIIDVVRSIDCFKKLNIDIIGVIQNMSYLDINGKKNYIFGKDAVLSMCKKYKLNFLADLPIEPDLTNVMQSNKIIINEKKQSIYCKNLAKLAKKIYDS